MTLADYDAYCYYVAGLVGVGLSRLFAAGGLEGPAFGDDAALGARGLSATMGLFLQKTNIIRDYLEDISEEPAPRMFWPRCVWSLYAPSLAHFRDPVHAPSALRCLNHLVTDALTHAPGSLEYLSRLRDPQVFRFCAIPQVMAIATLAACYNNAAVFTSVVKIARPESARIMVTTRGLGDVLAAFAAHSRALRRAIPAGDPNAATLAGVLTALDDAVRKHAALVPPPAPAAGALRLLLLLALSLAVALLALRAQPEALRAAMAAALACGLGAAVLLRWREIVSPT